MSAERPSIRLVYLLVAIAFLVVFASSAVKGVYQVYFVQLAEHFGQGRTRFAWSGSIFMLAIGFMSPVVGALSDRIGPMRTAAAGALAAGCAFLVSSFWNSSLWVFTAAFGIAGAFGLAAMTFVPMGVLVDRMFESRRKGLAYAVITNGTAIGFILLSPLWVWLEVRVEWTQVFKFIGWVFVGLIAVGILVASRWEPRAPQESLDEPEVSAWSVIRGDPVFYILALGFFGCGATMAFIDVHLMAHWQDRGASRLAMGYGLSMLGVIELLSGLAAGALALRWDKARLLTGFYALRSMSMFLLLVPGTGVLPFAVAFGASYLGTVILTSMFCFERYGHRIKGRVLGLLFLVHQLGAFASVQLGAYSYDWTRSYDDTIITLALLTVAAALVHGFGLKRATRTRRSGTIASGAALANAN